MATLHPVESGRHGYAISIAEHYYGDKADHWGRDLRFYVNVLAWANDVKTPIPTTGGRKCTSNPVTRSGSRVTRSPRSLVGKINSGSLSYEILDELGVAGFLRRLGDLIEDFQTAINKSGKYMADAIARHVTQALIDVVISLVTMMVAAIAIVAIFTALGGAIGFVFGGPGGAALGGSIGFELSLLFLRMARNRVPHQVAGGCGAVGGKCIREVPRRRVGRARGREEARRRRIRLRRGDRNAAGDPGRGGRRLDCGQGSRDRHSQDQGDAVRAAHGPEVLRLAKGPDGERGAAQARAGGEAAPRRGDQATRGRGEGEARTRRGREARARAQAQARGGGEGQAQARGKQRRREQEEERAREAAKRKQDEADKHAVDEASKREHEDEGKDRTTEPAKPPAEVWRVCFLAGTLVATEAGPVPIERIVVGTRVLATSASGNNGYYSVEATQTGFTRTIWRISVAGGEVSATRHHPFMVSDQGWKPASELTVGDMLVSSDAEPVEVLAVTSADASDMVGTCNLTVSGAASYYAYIGERAVLVHNAKPKTQPLPPTSACIGRSGSLGVVPGPKIDTDGISMWQTDNMDEVKEMMNIRASAAVPTTSCSTTPRRS